MEYIIFIKLYYFFLVFGFNEKIKKTMKSLLRRLRVVSSLFSLQTLTCSWVEIDLHLQARVLPMFNFQLNNVNSWIAITIVPCNVSSRNWLVLPDFKP